MVGFSFFHHNEKYLDDRRKRKSIWLKTKYKIIDNFLLTCFIVGVKSDRDKGFLS